MTQPVSTIIDSLGTAGAKAALGYWALLVMAGIMTGVLWLLSMELEASAQRYNRVQELTKVMFLENTNQLDRLVSALLADRPTIGNVVDREKALERLAGIEKQVTGVATMQAQQIDVLSRRLEVLELKLDGKTGR